MSRLFAYISALIISSMPVMAWAEEAAPVAAEGHEGGGGLPQFHTETWPSQIFWLVISFAILYIFFSKVILPRMTSTLENRADKIRDDIQTAEALSAKAEEIRQGYETELKRAAAQTSSDMKAIDEEAKAKLAKSLADFKGKYDAEVEKVEERLEKSKQDVLVDMQKIAAEIAAKAAEKIAGIPADQSQAETVVKSLKNKAA